MRLLLSPSTLRSRAAARCCVACIVLTLLLGCHVVPDVHAQPGPTPPAPDTPPPPVTVRGYAQVSWMANVNRPDSHTNQFRVFDVHDRSITVDGVGMVVERPLASAGVSAGFRIDGTAGSSIPQATAALGLFRHEGEPPPFVDLHQALVSIGLPVAGGIRIDAGKFSSHIGIESIPGPDADAPHLSRSFLFGYGQPTTHTGVKVAGHPHRRVDVMICAVNGWDRAVAADSRPSIGGQLAMIPSSRLAFSISYLRGPERSQRRKTTREIVDVTITARPMPRLWLAVNADAGSDVAPGTDAAVWRGAAGYARLTLTDRVEVAGRAEVFRDRTGTRTGIAQDLRAVTLTSTVRMVHRLSLQGELRHDRSSRSVFDRGSGGVRRYQTTVGFGMFLRW